MKRNTRNHSLAATFFLCLTVLCLCAGVFAISQAAKAEENGVEYRFDPENWMKYIPGDTDLTELNLPGTHASGTAFIKLFPESSSCQQYSIADQLQNGIRVMDIRIRYDGTDYGKLKIENDTAGTEKWPFDIMILSYGGIDCYESSAVSSEKLSVSKVINTCKEFVKTHPTETVVLQIKTETAPNDSDVYKADIKKGIKNIYNYLDNDSMVRMVEYGDSAPMLDDIRGKVVIFVEEISPKSNPDNGEYETSYHYGNMNDPDADDAPWKKVSYVYDALDSSGWQETEPRSSHASLVREPQYEQADENPRPEEGRPIFQQICTDATDVTDFGTTVVPTYGPEGYAKAMREALASYDWTVGKRYGIVRMDFPSIEMIRDVVEANNNYVRYQADIVWDDNQEHRLDDGLKIELAENGTALKMPELVSSEPLKNGENGFRLTYEIVPQRSREGAWYGGASFRVADGCAYALVSEPVEETREWFMDSNGEMYLGYVRTQKIHVGETETKAYDLPVYFMSETDDRSYRPAMTPQSFIDCLGELYISYDTGDGYQHTSLVSCGSQGGLYNLDSITGASDDKWILHITVPKFDRYGNELICHFSELDIRNGAPFVLCDCGQSDGIGLKLLSSDETVEAVIQYSVFADNGSNQFNEKSIIDNALMTGGIRHIAETEDGTVFIDEEITDPSLKRLNGGNLLLLTVRKYDEGFHVLHHRFEPLEVPHFDVSAANNTWSYRLMTDLTVKVQWNDFSDKAGIRPQYLDITFCGRNRKGAVLTDQPVSISLSTEDLEPSDGNRWNGTAKMPVLYFDPAEISGNVLDPDEKLTVLSAPGYVVDSIKKTKGTDSDGIPTYTFTISLSLDPANPQYVNVSGSFVFNDADLSIDHRGTVDQIKASNLYVKQNGKYMTDSDIRLTVDRENCTYAFIPLNKFPTFQITSYNKRAYVYTVEGTRYIGADADHNEYELLGTLGFDLFYRRLVSVSGTADWKDGTPSERELPIKVELLRDGEITGLSMYVNDQHQYVFDHLPIAGDNGVPYQYSIRAAVKGGEGTVVYPTVERDLTNGNFTANAMIANPRTVTVTNDGHGTATADPTSGLPETLVKLTAAPAEGYVFDHWEVISGGVTVTNDQFTIGTANVEIQACFRAITPVLTGISVTTAPEKTTYTVGESFDPTGMVVTATYSDGSSKPVTGYEYTPSGALALTDTAVEISYTEKDAIKTASLGITVNPPIEYAVIIGGNQTVYTDADSARFASDADFSKFDHVEVDGKTVAKKYYTAQSGSTVITFNRDFVKTLSIGKHTLTIVSTDGRAATEFFLEPLPHTGDGSRIGLWLALLACAGIALALLCGKRFNRAE